MRPTLRSYRLLTLALAALLPAGCAQRISESQQRFLDEGRAAYDKEQYNQAVERLTVFLSQVREGPEVAQALYLRGASQARAGRRAEALSDLNAAVGRPDADADTQWRAYVVIGTIYFEDGRWEPARQAYSAAAARMTSEPPKQLVLFRMGVCYERVGRWADARRTFADLVAQFPKTGPTPNVSEAAERRVELGADCFAVQCGAFSQEQNAQNKATELGRRGFAPYIRKEPRGSGTVYVVLVGRFSDYNDAMRQLASVRQFVADAVLWP